MSIHLRVLILVFILIVVAGIAMYGLSIQPPQDQKSTSTAPVEPSRMAAAPVVPVVNAPPVELEPIRSELQAHTEQFGRMNSTLSEIAARPPVVVGADASSQGSSATSAASGARIGLLGVGGGVPSAAAPMPPTLPEKEDALPEILRYPGDHRATEADLRSRAENELQRLGYLKQFVANYTKIAVGDSQPGEFWWLEGLTLANRVSDAALQRPFDNVREKVRQGAFHEIFRDLKKHYAMEAEGMFGPSGTDGVSAGFIPLIEKIAAINRRFFRFSVTDAPGMRNFRVLDTPDTLDNPSAYKMSYVFAPENTRTGNQYAIASVYLCLLEQLGYRAAPVRLPDRVLVRVRNPDNLAQYVNVDVSLAGTAPLSDEDYRARYRLSAEEQHHYLNPELNVAQWIAELMTKEAALLLETNRALGIQRLQTVLGLDQANHSAGTPYDAFNREARYHLARALLLDAMTPREQARNQARPGQAMHVASLSRLPMPVRETARGLLEEAVGRRPIAPQSALNQPVSADYVDANLLLASLAVAEDAGDGNIGDVERYAASVERQAPQTSDGYLYYVRALARDRAGGAHHFKGALDDLDRWEGVLTERLARLQRLRQGSQTALRATGLVGERHATDHAAITREHADMEALLSSARALRAQVRVHGLVGVITLGGDKVGERTRAVALLADHLAARRGEYSEAEIAALLVLADQLSDPNVAYAWNVHHALRRVLKPGSDLGLDPGVWRDVIRRAQTAG